jgi:hypothetical protein
VAPTSISVHRKEVYEAIRKENELAATMRGEIPSLRSPSALRDGLKRLAHGSRPGLNSRRDIA